MTHFFQLAQETTNQNLNLKRHRHNELTGGKGLVRICPMDRRASASGGVERPSAGLRLGSVFSKHKILFEKSSTTKLKTLIVSKFPKHKSSLNDFQVSTNISQKVQVSKRVCRTSRDAGRCQVMRWPAIRSTGRTFGICDSGCATPRRSLKRRRSGPDGGSGANDKPLMCCFLK